MFARLWKFWKELPETHPRHARLLFQSVTVLAAAASLLLILSMALSGGRDTEKPEEGAQEPNALLRQPSDVTLLPAAPSQSAAPAAPSPAPEPAALRLTFTDAEASSVVAFALNDRLPMEEVAVAFAAPDNVTIRGRIAKESLGAVIDGKDLPLAKAALVLAPDMLDGVMTFRLTLDEAGALHAEPVTVLLNDFDVTKLIPRSAVDAANDALQSLLADNHAAVRSLEIADGSVTFELQA